MPVKIEVDLVEDPETKHKILRGIPLDFLYQFKKNPTAAARDVGAVVSSVVHPYFDQKMHVVNAMGERPNPFLEREIAFEDWFTCADKFARYLHFDLAATRCSAGLALTHTPGYVVRKTEDGKDVRLPYIVVDFLGRCTAPEGEEIDLVSLAEIPFIIQDLGFDLALVTYDRWESRQNIQRLKHAGIKSALLSIERTSHRIILDVDAKEGVRLESTRGLHTAAWTTLKDAFYEDRLSVPQHPYFLQDCEDCEKDERRNKVVVSNRPGAKFDMIQALAGSVFNLVCNEEPWEEYQEVPSGLQPVEHNMFTEIKRRGKQAKFEMDQERNESADLEDLDALSDLRLPDILEG